MKKFIFLIVVFVLLAGCSNQKNEEAENLQTPIMEQETPQVMPEDENIEENIAEEAIQDEDEEIKKEPAWKSGSAAISGKYADTDIIRLDDGSYRMYYSAEPEVPGFKGQVYSAVSSDGIAWNQEDGQRMEWAIFPSVIKLSNGKYRMYFQNQGIIKSAISSDGLSWKEESGTRIDASNDAGLKLENVASPTVIEAGNEYIMVYRGTINEKYPAEVPNPNTQLFLWAVSKDGLTFEKKGIALDSRNEEFKGLLDGPEFVLWDDGIIQLYFWSYKGVYHAAFESNKFSENPVFDFTTSSNSMQQFPENPPGDPTLIKINSKWFMYYGQHTKGIFYATLEN